MIVDKYRLQVNVQRADPRLRDHHRHHLQNTGTKDGLGREAPSFDPVCSGRGDGRSNNTEGRENRKCAGCTRELRNAPNAPCPQGAFSALGASVDRPQTVIQDMLRKL